MSMNTAMCKAFPRPFVVIEVLVGEDIMNPFVSILKARDDVVIETVFLVYADVTIGVPLCEILANVNTDVVALAMTTSSLGVLAA